MTDELKRGDRVKHETLGEGQIPALGHVEPDPINVEAGTAYVLLDSGKRLRIALNMLTKIEPNEAFQFQPGDKVQRRDCELSGVIVSELPIVSPIGTSWAVNVNADPSYVEHWDERNLTKIEQPETLREKLAAGLNNCRPFANAYGDVLADGIEIGVMCSVFQEHFDSKRDEIEGLIRYGSAVQADVDTLREILFGDESQTV